MKHLEAVVEAMAKRHWETIRGSDTTAWEDLTPLAKHMVREQVLPLASAAVGTYEQYQEMESAMDAMLLLPYGEAPDPNLDDAQFTRLIMAGWLHAALLQFGPSTLNSPYEITPEINAAGEFTGASFVTTKSKNVYRIEILIVEVGEEREDDINV